MYTILLEIKKIDGISHPKYGGCFFSVPKQTFKFKTLHTLPFSGEGSYESVDIEFK